ncbi:DUF4258 domain-containing protein [Nocardia sp. NPDC049707]|uniref:DUF4258 domain-containing protein n=1 Tax=Nocardia sp. NPDC049707 TaxID=3154735 RepID=UPI00342988A3
MQTFTRATAKLVAAVAILISAMPVASAVAESPAVLEGQVSAQAINGSPTDFQAARGRPNYIAGYTQHARERMALRNISEMQVQDVISSKVNGVWQPDKETWKVCWNNICVAISEDAYIVTVF